jgi:monooxygenase
MAPEQFDVLIIGAGLSGVGAGVHLQQRCPGKTYLIVEAREAIGGTWDLFRYPGIRSDSDMYTLGYSFKPWTRDKSIADGASILEYVRETAREHGVDRHIRFRQRVVGAQWSSAESKWIVTVERGPAKEQVRYACSFLYMCGGYYRYDAGYTPDFPGVKDFRGQVIHPQQWPENLDYAGKRVVVIGSGATAVTLVPAMAEKAAQVTMLQRSPTYIINLPSNDRIANTLRKFLPVKLAYWLTRWKQVLLSMLIFQLSRRRPQAVKRMIRRGIRAELGRDYDMRHFTPSYNPWDQRLCLVPDSDLFKAIRSGRAAVVTDHIDTFTPTGIRLKSGQELEADIVVTATGLALNVMGDMQFTVDGRPVDLPRTLTYRGMMLSDVPNFAFAVGYTNASWTLKIDLTSAYVCRLLNHMDRHGHTQVVARASDPTVQPQPLIDFSSGYVQRAIDKLPKQGNKTPWKLYQNYFLDILLLRFGSLKDGALEFGKSAPAVPAQSAA